MPEGLDGDPPRPIDETYWVLPGRLLVGEYPGSHSRAEAMDRISRFIGAGISCFIDLTEPDECPAYEQLLPKTMRRGIGVKYLREPIVDHGVPGGADQMARIIGAIDDALGDGHNVYLHCRAGIGRSALAAGCWLAEKRGSTAAAVAELNESWQQAAQSSSWSRVPETDQQLEYLARWIGPNDNHVAPRPVARAVTPDPADKLRGAWYGLALGDASGAAKGRDARSRAWTQPTALTLCLAHSLLELQRFDARDQIERYLRWQREGYCAADGAAGEAQATPDVVKALATYMWRKQPMAGSHDPKDAAPTSLPRVLAVVSTSAAAPALAVSLAAESSRTTHQAPVVLDACRLLAAMMCAALAGEAPTAWLAGVCEPLPGFWKQRPLRKDVQGMANRTAYTPVQAAAAPAVLQVLSRVRRTILEATDFDAAVSASRQGSPDAPLEAALAGMLFGLRHGHAGLPAERCASLRGKEQLDAVLQQFAGRPAELRA
jgi:ADP-ribosylglycohydrolase